MEKYFRKTAEEVLGEFHVTHEGLTAAQVEENFQKYGENALQEEERPGVLKVFAGQFKDLLVIILLAAAIISMIPTTALVIILQKHLVKGIAMAGLGGR